MRDVRVTQLVIIVRKLACPAAHTSAADTEDQIKPGPGRRPHRPDQDPIPEPHGPPSNPPLPREIHLLVIFPYDHSFLVSSFLTTIFLAQLVFYTESFRPRHTKTCLFEVDWSSYFATQLNCITGTATIPALSEPAP